MVALLVESARLVAGRLQPIRYVRWSARVVRQLLYLQFQQHHFLVQVVHLGDELLQLLQVQVRGSSCSLLLLAWWRLCGQFIQKHFRAPDVRLPLSREVPTHVRITKLAPPELGFGIVHRVSRSGNDFVPTSQTQQKPKTTLGVIAVIIEHPWIFQLFVSTFAIEVRTIQSIRLHTFTFIRAVREINRENVRYGKNRVRVMAWVWVMAWLGLWRPALSNYLLTCTDTQHGVNGLFNQYPDPDHDPDPDPNPNPNPVTHQ